MELAVKLLLKMEKLGNKKNKFPILCWIIFCPFEVNQQWGFAACCVPRCYFCSRLWCTYGKDIVLPK